jgi:protein ImuA
MESFKFSEIQALRSRIARIQAAGSPKHLGTAIPFGISAIDNRLPGNGLQNVLHEVAGLGPETEHGAAAARFIAGILARRTGPVLWAQEWPDLHAPALAGAGLAPSRVICLLAGPRTLAAMEEGLHTRSLAGVVGETSTRVTLTASRRLHLAAETSGVPAFLLRRSRRFGDAHLAEPSAATTRWRVSPLPAPPPMLRAPTVSGLARAVWRLDLIRCRGGEAASWIVEATDAQGRLRLVSDLSDRQIAEGRRLAVGGRTIRHRVA